VDAPLDEPCLRQLLQRERERPRADAERVSELGETPLAGNDPDGNTLML
jgi:hypothetical protein